MDTTSPSSAMPTLRFAMGAKVVPGDRIGTVKQVFPGIGTYAKGGHVYASVLGHINLVTTTTSTTSEEEQNDDPTAPSFTVSVVPQKSLASEQIIAVGQRVMGRITKVAASQATLEILALEGVGRMIPTTLDASSLNEGMISRDEAVKAGAATILEIHECFQPKDIVLAKVLSLGDARRYYLTTAEPELGVLHAICYVSQQPMIPISWQEMECPDTGLREPRKCAKPRRITSTSASGTGETTTA